MPGRRYFKNTAPPSGNPGGCQPWIRSKVNEILGAILNSEQRIASDCDGGLYVGLGGVGYALFHLGKVFNNKDWIVKADQYLKINNQYYLQSGRRLRAGDRLGFLLGKAGIDAVRGVVAKELEGGASMGSADSSSTSALAEFAACARELAGSRDPLGCGSDEVLVGRAGYILGALWVRQAANIEAVPLKTLHHLCDVTLSSGRQYAAEVRSPSPLMYQYYGTEYLGAAHGVCGILQALMSVPGYFQHNPGAEPAVKAAVDFYLSLQTAEGNFPCAMDELGPNARSAENDLVHWCHGAPGAVYMLARAYLVWKEDKYLQSALRAGECVWNKGLLKKGPGICHGVAGSGYVFLLLYRLTGDANHLYRAEKFAEFLFTEEFRGARVPDCPFSLYEGWAGTLCFLADLTQPQHSSFPFSNVFM